MVIETGRKGNTNTYLWQKIVIKLKQLLENKDSKHAAGIAYVFDNKLLCVQDTKGKWGIPKGHKHIDETPEEAAFREFTEET